MATNIRLRGGKTDNYTVTLNNQVGPDTDDQHDRSISYSTTSVIYVSKDGDDSNAGTSTSAPKLTIQNAIDTAVADSELYVVILDSGTYIETVNLYGKYLLAEDECSPTIKFTGVIDSTSLGTISAGDDITQIEYWSEKGTWLAICNSGIYYSGSLSSWSAVSGTSGIYSFTISGDRVYFQYNSGTTYKIQYITTSTYTPADFYDASTDVNGDIVYVERPAEYTGKIISKNGSEYEVYLTPYSPTIIEDADSATDYAAYGAYIYLLKDGAIFYIDDTGVIATGISDTIGGVTTDDSYVYLTTGATGNIYRSAIASGSVFSFVSQIEEANDIIVVNGYVVCSDYTNNDIYYSYNSGASWVQISGSYDYSIGQESSDGFILGGSDGIVYRLNLAVVSNYYGVSVVNGITIDGENKSYYGIFAPNDEFNCNWCTIKNEYVASRVYTVADQSDFVNCIIENCDYLTGVDYIGYPVLGNADNCIFNDISSGGMYILEANHCIFYNCGSGVKRYASGTTNITNSIFWNTGIPFGFTENVSEDSNIDYNLYIQPTTAASVEMYTTQYTNNPLFQDENSGNFKLQSKAEGYGIDSLYLAGGDYESSDNKDMGAWDITRTLDSTTYTDDYTLKINPTAVNVEYRVPNYSTATNANGEVSEWATSRDGHIRRTFSLPYTDGTVNSNWYRQLHDIVYLYGKVGQVYEFGYTDDDGSTWTAMRSGTGTVTDSDIVVTYADEEWAVNKWAGYWILIDGEHYRITASTAKTESGSCTFTVDGEPSTGSQAWQIDFVLVTLNKKTGLTPKSVVYTGEDDYTDVPATGYTITLNEVDDYDI